MGCDYKSFNPGTCPTAFGEHKGMKGKKKRTGTVKKSKSVTNFAICDKIIWNRNVNPALIDNLIELYGKGPFRVVGIKLVEKYTHKSPVHPLDITVEIPSNGQRLTFEGLLFKKFKKIA